MPSAQGTLLGAFTNHAQIIIPQSRIRTVPKEASHPFDVLGQPHGQVLGSQVEGSFRCQWRGVETLGVRTRQGCPLDSWLNARSKNKGGINGASLKGRVSLTLQSGSCNHHVCVFASLIGQVREKKDVPLGPEDPKEEDGSFDYRWVIYSAAGPHSTIHPAVTTGSWMGPPPGRGDTTQHTHMESSPSHPAARLQFTELLTWAFPPLSSESRRWNAVAVK